MAFKNIFTLTNLTQVTALLLSSVAAWFAIAGLISIFPARATGILIMGAIIEIAKIVAIIWLRKYWEQAGYQFKLLLIPMIIIAMSLTSMGTFGYLSAAHSEQSLASGDVQSKIAIYDEKIKTAKENIEADRKQLKQMDEAVDQVMARSTTEEGASRSNAIRKAQARDRSALAKNIEANQKLIATLNDEAAPLRAEIRKVEAEVGPVKYIAAIIYGDNTDVNTLEKAVRWVIIMLVLVFDPFAIALVIAASSSREWDKKTNKKEAFITENQSNTTIEELHGKQEDIKQEIIDNSEIDNEPIVDDEKVDRIIELKEDIKLEEPHETTEIKHKNPVYEVKENGYVLFEGKQIRLEALKELHPELFITADAHDSPVPKFGTQFPKKASIGEVYIRVDMSPNLVYKFDGKRWVEINKNSQDMDWNEEYLQYLISKIDSGEYNIELLSDIEKNQIARYLESQK